MTRTSCVWVWLWAVAVGTGAQAQERFALVIGANAGWSNDRPLRHAESDAEHVRDVLVELGGFAADRVQLLLDPDTTQVKAALNTLNANMRALGGQTLLFFYYSGHADEQHLHLKGAPLWRGELLSLLRESAGQLRLGVMDACRSGSIVAAKEGRPRVLFNTQVVDELEENGLAVLTSSGADELSQGKRALGGSVFTHHLVSGLRGAADRDDDGQVTLSEAYEYALGRTQADTGSPESQGPKLSGEGTRVLTWLTHGAATLVLQRGEGERYLVVDRYEWKWVAEVRAQPEREVVLALPPGEYRLKRAGEQQLEVSAVQLPVGARVEVSGLSFEPRPLSAGLLNGRPDRNHTAEVRAWRRSEALRLLAAGEARAALRLFNRILEEVPDDAAALRGRGRALVRLAEAYARAKDSARERHALRSALVSDPSLAEDLEFQQWYQPMKQAAAAELKQYESYNRSEAEFRSNPRSGYKWGLGLDAKGPRGLLALSISLVVKDSLFPYVAMDLLGRALDGGIRWAVLPKRWSPFLGVGLYVPGLGIDLFKSEDLRPPSLHLEGGLQFVGQNGIGAELGATILLHKDSEGKLVSELAPVVGVQWFFK